MDLRNLPEGLNPEQRTSLRREKIEGALEVELANLAIAPDKIGSAEEKNCEQMFGAVPIPVGYAGPLNVIFSSGDETQIHLPLATTEGALVASVNRGCKALSELGSVRVTSIHHGVSRSMAFKSDKPQELMKALLKGKWKEVGEETSSHLSITKYEIDQDDDHIFLTIFANTDEAMGMNMITVAAQAIGDWIADSTDAQFITVASNIDSDKKPSLRTHERGRGYEVIAEAVITEEIIESILKTSPEAMLAVVEAKLKKGSKIAGAIGANLHTANIVAALNLATGQDATHVVEGSLADTTFEKTAHGYSIRTRLPAILVGVRGGGTDLPAQAQCLSLLLSPKTSLHPCAQLAESYGAAVLAGELSVLAAQSAHQLAKAHQNLAR